MHQRVERVLNWLLTLSAVCIALVVVHREFLDAGATRPSRTKPEYVRDWQSMVSSGRVIGNPDAKFKIIEFSDLECPFCRGFNRSVQSLRASHPNDVALIFVHFPLSIHRFARPAARAAECAVPMQTFGAMVDAIFEKQDSLGLKTWVSYARDARIDDTVAFAKCVGAADPLPAVDAGVRLANDLGLTGTPSVILNGWRYREPPNDSVLAAAFRKAVAVAPGA